LVTAINCIKKVLLVTATKAKDSSAVLCL